MPHSVSNESVDSILNQIEEQNKKTIKNVKTVEPNVQ